MDMLYHRTSALLEEVHRHFVRLERSPPEKAPLVEQEIQSFLDSINDNCSKLDILVNKEIPSRRVAARVQVDQLKYDCRHYQTSLQNAIHRRMLREQEMREREELLSKKFSTNEENTTIMIDHSLQHNTSLQNANRGMDDLLGSGNSILTNLREQRVTLKGAHKKILDIANTLGLSNTVMRLIEKRTYQDKYVLFGGMFVTCVIMFLVVKYLT
ncbi:Golgi SNAP receptor complex member 2-like [Argiope bruennichi]|uniref:Golgi SNAP receptor complex member 2 n=1 Tax=Argiope bruennichi TaxID=94029 RepID=A0A8T0ECM0_ARGBR|nr:Golgi SNAP receptor complex member 2-like [Argiope bruennichi]KAF8768181.1 Golgi SNAP receptor complex member 2 like protein [Argiope bruennichi]